MHFADVKKDDIFMTKNIGGIGDFFFCGPFIFFQNQLFQNLLSGIYHKSVKLFRSRSGWTFFLSWSGSKVFAKFIIVCKGLSLLNLDLFFLENTVDPDQLAFDKAADQEIHCFLLLLKKYLELECCRLIWGE